MGLDAAAALEAANSRLEARVSERLPPLQSNHGRTHIDTISKRSLKCLFYKKVLCVLSVG
jgi:hypothetical protein